MSNIPVCHKKNVSREISNIPVCRKKRESRNSAWLLLFSLPGGGGDAPLNGPAGQQGVRTGASSGSSAAAAGKGLAHYRPWAQTQWVPWAQCVAWAPQGPTDSMKAVRPPIELTQQTYPISLSLHMYIYVTRYTDMRTHMCICFSLHIYTYCDMQCYYMLMRTWATMGWWAPLAHQSHKKQHRMNTYIHTYIILLCTYIYRCTCTHV